MLFSLLSKQSILKMLNKLSCRQGRKYDAPASKKEIEPFVRYFHINPDEAELPLSEYPNFNAFFSRRLKPGSRVIPSQMEGGVIASPADSRLSVFESVEEAQALWIKGDQFTLSRMFDDDLLGMNYDGGSVMVCRLAPQDYHRFHFPFDCTLKSVRDVNGALFTVNPIAVNSTSVNVFTQNKRAVAILDSPVYGEVPFVIVGATMVGSIFLSVQVGAEVKKGDEFGGFKFGGSTVIAVFRKGLVRFDDDLLSSSRKQIESLVKMGESVGVRMGE
mmetsp:Transcript_42738/g.110158  ORF Transcript_42738/g.110158 Transcript_42738/m.110158 type:complete len:274 (-) Transcript_42738:102-923(-)